MKHMTHWLIVMSIVGGATAAPARAAPYWVAWEGNDFPENEGWLREGDEADPVRTLNNGVMNLNSLASERSEDFYRIYGASDPEPGEEFVVQWRLRVNQVDWDSPLFQYDPGWGINSADGWRAVFVIGEDELHNQLEQVDVLFQAGAFHHWEFRSPDMRTFTLSLDGVAVSSGAFVFTGLEPRMHWGDFVRGPTSNVDWDYFRFGVVPEPATGLAFFVASLFCYSRKQRNENDTKRNTDSANHFRVFGRH
jgi:hypothetical protein